LYQRPRTCGSSEASLPLTSGSTADHQKARGKYDVQPVGARPAADSVEKKETSLARVKRTGRADARRRYRQTQAEEADQPEGTELAAADLDYGERRTDLGRPKAAAKPSDQRTPDGRLGVMGAFRAAYHPAHIREDLRLLPTLVRSRAFIAGALSVIGAGVIYASFSRMTGGQLVWDLFVLPSSALIPQLVVGFFAPRASYLLGFLVGVIQASVYAVLLPTYAAVVTELGATITPEQIESSRLSGFLNAPVVGLLFASMAAWYRRFLSLSGRRRPAPSRAAKASAARRPASR
jgi:hypothetical protein